MKTIYTLAVMVWLTGVFAARTAAQTSDARLLTNEGNELSNQKNYTAAMAKYKAALAIDPDYAPANYQMGFCLSAAGKGLDGIPYLEKIFTAANASANLVSGAYDLAGSIYDQNHELQKAIATYKAGIKANPGYQPLQYDLGLVYFRNKQYANAEAAAIEGIKLDPKHTGSMRLYALVCFHQNKRAAALLGFCSFLILEPNTSRSAEAYGNIQHIIQGGALKPEPGEMVPHAIEAGTYVLNQAIMQSIQPFAKKRYATPADLLAAQLAAIFNSVGILAAKQTGNEFFRNYMAGYFYKLAQTSNMPAFARLVSLSTPESSKWVNDHPQQMTDLDNWLKGTERQL